MLYCNLHFKMKRCTNYDCKRHLCRAPFGEKIEVQSEKCQKGDDDRIMKDTLVAVATQMTIEDYMGEN